MDLLTARYLEIPWIFPERISSDARHNLLVPLNPDQPIDVVQTVGMLGIQIVGWTFDSQLSSKECLCLFTGEVCCLVTGKGLRFIAHRLS